MDRVKKLEEQVESKLDPAEDVIKAANDEVKAATKRWEDAPDDKKAVYERLLNAAIASAEAAAAHKARLDTKHQTLLEMIKGAAGGGGGEGAQAQQPYYKDKWYFSPKVCERFGLCTPWEQWGLLASTVAGGIPFVKHVKMAWALDDVVNMDESFVRQKKIEHYKFTDHQLMNHRTFSTNMKIKAAALFVAPPLLWVFAFSRKGREALGMQRGRKDGEVDAFNTSKK